MAKKPAAAVAADDIELDAGGSGDVTEAPAAEEQAPEAPALTVERRKVSRGSNRRITRALENLETALDAFIAEMSLQVFLTDADGTRSEHTIVTGAKAFKKFTRADVNEILHAAQ